MDNENKTVQENETLTPEQHNSLIADALRKESIEMIDHLSFQGKAAVSGLISSRTGLSFDDVEVTGNTEEEKFKNAEKTIADKIKKAINEDFANDVTLLLALNAGITAVMYYDQIVALSAQVYADKPKSGGKKSKK